MLLRPISELNPPAIEWLWPGYLAIGSLAIIDGDPGLGKSLVTLDLTARLTSGRPWPDGAPGPGPAAVVLLCDEDPEAHIKARLNALGAEQPRTYLWPRLEEPGLPRLPADLDRVDQAVGETGAKLVIIDPVMAFLDRTVMTNSDANVRRALHPLAQLAERRRCVILLVRHLNKDDSPHALYRGGGSIAFVAACRLAWIAGRDPRREDRLVLAQAKNNYSPRQPSLAYALPKDAPRVDWQGTSVWGADELAARCPRPSRRRARDFLRLFLEAGPRTTQEIWTASREHGFCKETLRRAKKDLGITWERIEREGRRIDYWLLPGQKLADGPVSETPLADEWLRKWREMYPPRTPLDDDAKT